MAKKSESHLQLRIQKAVRREFDCWGFKVAGGPFQPSGIPDLLFCIEGIFFAFEVKMPLSGKLSKIQELTLERIRKNGKGQAHVVTSPDETVDIIRRALVRHRCHEVEDERGCWEFSGHKNRQGYGRARVKGKLTRMHRWSYDLVKGPIPPGLHVLHKCDNPPCINPDHLFLGTDEDNVRDREAKGRGVRKKGTSHWKSQLTEEDVKAIRKARKRQPPTSLKTLSKIYNVKESAISHAALGKSWKHLD